MAARRDKIVFVISALWFAWLGMMAIHELGHVIGAVLTGGRVLRVVLHPAAISRTDVSPNPVPLMVAWAGPILGCLIPLLMMLAVCRVFRFNSGPSMMPKVDPGSSLSTHESAGGNASTDQWGHKIRLEGRSEISAFSLFFSGFCCVANGAYLGLGVFDRIGDADELLKAGSAPLNLVVFGLIAFVAGMLMWHRLGSPLAMLCGPMEIDPWLVRGLVATLLLVIAVECIFSPA